MISKITNKSKAFHKHGKHPSVLMEVRRLEKEKPRRRGDMKPSLRDLFREVK